MLFRSPFFESVGKSTKVATLIMLALTMTTGGLRSVLGIIVDRVAYPHRLAASLSTSMALGITILTISAATPAIAVFMPFWAIGMAGGPVFEPVLYLRGFGARHFGQILGTAGLVETIGSWAGPVAAGLVYDTTGSYRLALGAFAALFVTAAVFFLRAGTTARDRAAARATQASAPT